MSIRVLELPTNQWSLKVDPRVDPSEGPDETVGSEMVPPQVHHLAKIGLMRRVMMQEPEAVVRDRPGVVRATSATTYASLRKHG